MLYIHILILTTQAHETQRQEATYNLQDLSVRITEGVFWDMKCISRTTIILPELLHTIY
jgi:hypothetical protein